MGKKRSLTPAERSIIERTTWEIGGVYDIGGVFVKCVERPRITCPLDACRDCYFSEAYKTCPPSQCSSFGRTDGRNVWFVKVSDE